MSLDLSHEYSVRSISGFSHVIHSIRSDCMPFVGALVRNPHHSKNDIPVAIRSKNRLDH